jgi:hypothetical protein
MIETELIRVGLVPNGCRRIILDIEAHSAPNLYYQTFADTRLLDIDWGKVAPEIVRHGDPVEVDDKG